MVCLGTGTTTRRPTRCGPLGTACRTPPSHTRVWRSAAVSAPPRPPPSHSRSPTPARCVFVWRPQHLCTGWRWLRSFLCLPRCPRSSSRGAVCVACLIPPSVRARPPCLLVVLTSLCFYWPSALPTVSSPVYFGAFTTSHLASHHPSRPPPSNMTSFALPPPLATHTHTRARTRSSLPPRARPGFPRPTR